MRGGGNYKGEGRAGAPCFLLRQPQQNPPGPPHRRVRHALLLHQPVHAGAIQERPRQHQARAGHGGGKGQAP
jgi:hypothetical protein